MSEINSETLKVAIILTKDIDELDLSVVCYNSLRRWGIRTIANLCEACMEDSIKKIRGIGAKSIAEINHAIECYFEKYGLGVELKNEVDT